jgi:DNA end-binding protein Ku
MAARAIWKGSLKVGASSIPVKLYAAVEDRTIRFHVLQGGRSRVKQRMVRPERGGQVSKEEIRKGYEIENGEFVIIADQEAAKLKPKESRDVRLLRFVPPSAIANSWYDRPYYVGPDGEESKYFAMVEAVRNREVEGVARWTMRGKSYVGALLSDGDRLVLIKLRYSQEVLPTQELPAADGRALSAKELRMAEELVSALEGEFKLEEFRDEYRERLQNFIEAKAKGKRPRLAAVKTRETGGALDDRLAKSIAALKRGREKKVA